MKKSNLWWSLGTMALGLLCFLGGWLLPASRPVGVLWGMGFGLLLNGLVQLFQYWKWTRPENAAAYAERRELEQIEFHDERNVQLRDRSGRYAYLFGLAVGVLALLVLSGLEVFGLAQTRWAVVFLGFYVLLQWLAGLWFYRRLKKQF